MTTNRVDAACHAAHEAQARRREARIKMQYSSAVGFEAALAAYRQAEVDESAAWAAAAAEMDNDPSYPTTK